MLPPLAPSGCEQGALGEDLVFVANATTGVNIVARSLALQPGDEVLATDHEYGACDAAWEFVCAQRGASYRRVAVPLPFERSAWAPTTTPATATSGCALPRARPSCTPGPNARPGSMPPC